MEFAEQRTQHAERWNSLDGLVCVKVEAQSGLQRSQGHLVQAEGPHEWVLFDAFDQFSTPGQNARLRAAEQLIAAEKHQVRTAGDATAYRRFLSKAERPKLQQGAAADVIDDGQLVLPARPTISSRETDSVKPEMR